MMNPDHFQQTLLRAARAHPPSEDVPYAFEQRIMASLRSRPPVDAWTLWSRALWRAAAPCLTLTIGLTLWSLASPPLTLSEDNLDAVLDRTVAAAVDSSEILW